MKDSIVQAGALVLRQKAKPVSKKEFGTKALSLLIHTMKSALTKEKYGVAIAAPQVGVSQRIFVVAGRAFITDEDTEDVAHTPKSVPLPSDMVFINPELLRVSRKKHEMSEGCLSVRGKYGTVMRHEKATVRACNEKGEQFMYHASGLLAHIFQHECDHLEGILYIDKAIKLTNDEEKVPQTNE